MFNRWVCLGLTSRLDTSSGANEEVLRCMKIIDFEHTNLYCDFMDESIIRSYRNRLSYVPKKNFYESLRKGSRDI